MEWISAIRKSVDYIEEHLKDKIVAQDVADQLYMSQVHFQKGFLVMTGYSVAEYIRNRRLYMAALELKDSDKKVIDVALEYGYETPESFTKAFTRFHGVSPSEIKQGCAVRTFLPLAIKIDVTGGDKMDVKIRNLFGFKVIGFAKEFEFETAYEEIPKYWDEICEKYAANVYSGNPPANEYEKALMDNCIGEYGVCIDDESIAGTGKFLYLIAGKYVGGEVPEGQVQGALHRGRDEAMERRGGLGVEVPRRATQAHELRMAQAARVPDRVGPHRVRVQGHRRAAVQGRGDALALRERSLRDRTASADAQRGLNDQKEENMEHTVNSYRDLIAWQRARELVKEVYLLTATFSVGERFGLVSQMDRSAVSIPSNIAEGYGRATTQDYLHFLRIARGSAYELETQLVLAEDLALCGQEASSKVAATLQEVIRLLQGLIAALERRTER